MNKDIPLSKGCITAFMQEKGFVGDLPVLQILGTKVTTNDQGDTHYDVYLSDGEKVMLFTSTVQLNKQFSSGKLSVFTVVKIVSVKKNLSNTISCLINKLSVISNGLEIRKMIGNPTPLESKMKEWLTFFTRKLDMSMMIQLRVNAFQKQCLNSSKNISGLTTGCLEKIRSGEIINKPLLQVLTLVKVTNAEENSFNYSVELSDGKFSFNRFYTRSTHFNNLVAAGLISKLSIIRLEKYEQSDFKSRIKIRNVTVVNKGSDVKSIIGDPEPVKDGSSQRYAVTDKMLNRLMSYTDLSSSILDTACLSDMQHEVAVSAPILQLINSHKYAGECKIEISDGLFKIYTEMLNSEITEKVNSGELLQGSTFRVDEYEVSIVKQEYDTYIPFVSLLKITVLNSSSHVIIGRPIPSGACKGMPEDEEGEIFEEEEYDGACSSGKATKTTMQSIKDQMTKEGALRFFNKPDDDDDDDNVDDDVNKIEKSSVDNAEMIKRHNELKEQLSTLTIKINEFKDQKEDFKNGMTKLTKENSKLKKRYEKMRKAKVIGKQKLIENYLEITGIQTRPNENLLEIIKKIAEIIEVQLNSEVDIVSVTRDPNSRAILVCCNNTTTKQTFLDARRGTYLCSSILSLNIPKKAIKIHELLTPFNKLIMFQARNLRDNGRLSFVWSKNGRVFIKSPENGSKAIHVYSLDQLKRILKS